MGYYIDQLSEQDRQKRLADLLAMQQDNSEPGVQFDTGPQNIASITRGRSEEEINQILSGMRISTPGFNSATFNSDGSNPQPAQVQPPQLPRNYVQMGNNAPIDLGPSVQNTGPTPDYSSPMTSMDGTPGYWTKGRNGSQAILRDGRVMNYSDPVDPRQQLQALQMAKARQELEQGEVESQLKRAQLNEALNPKKATGFSSMKEIFDAENKLADDHKMQAKDFIAVRDAYSRLDTAMEKATTSAPSALAGATVFMKLLDPGSVVRESELGMALAATGAIDRMENYYNTLKNGKVLTESQAKEFKLVGKQLYEAAKTNQTQLDQYYTGRAKAYGLDPSKVVGDYYLKEKPASAPTTTPSPALSPAEQQELAQLRARFKK